MSILVKKKSNMKGIVKNSTILLILTGITIFVCSSCGSNSQSSDTKMYNGSNVNASESYTKSTVALLNSQGEPFCSGSLITPRSVIAAGHCYMGSNGQPIQVSFGTNTGSGPSISVPFSNQYRHKNYKEGYGGLLNNDLAFLVLPEDAPAGYSPVRILNGSLQRGDSIVLAGFGMTEAGTGGGYGQQQQMPYGYGQQQQMPYGYGQQQQMPYGYGQQQQMPYGYQQAPQGYQYMYPGTITNDTLDYTEYSTCTPGVGICTIDKHDDYYPSTYYPSSIRPISAGGGARSLKKIGAVVSGSAGGGVFTFKAGAGKGVCSGDSGGPAFKISSGTPQLVGVASAVNGDLPSSAPGVHCGTSGYYTDITLFKKWLVTASIKGQIPSPDEYWANPGQRVPRQQDQSGQDNGNSGSTDQLQQDGSLGQAPGDQGSTTQGYNHESRYNCYDGQLKKWVAPENCYPGLKPNPEPQRQNTPQPETHVDQQIPLPDQSPSLPQQDRGLSQPDSGTNQGRGRYGCQDPDGSYYFYSVPCDQIDNHSDDFAQNRGDSTYGDGDDGYGRNPEVDEDDPNHGYTDEIEFYNI